MENRKFLTKGRVIIGCIVLFLCLPFLFSFAVGIASLIEGEQWVYFHSVGRSGRVVAADTNTPVEGAVVIADWNTWPMVREPHPVLLILYINPLHYMGYGLIKTFGSGKTIVTSTDKDGKYDIPSWWSFQPWAYTQIGSEAPNMCIYKPGYKTLYTDLGRWMTNGKEISANTNNLTFIKSLTVKEIEEDFEIYQTQCLDHFPRNQNWFNLLNLIEKSLLALPKENRKKIEKYISERK